MNPRTKRIGKILAIVVAVIAALYLGLTIWSFVALHRAYAALARDGRPMKLEEIMPPPISDADNAAPLYKAAVKIFKDTQIPGETGRHLVGQPNNETLMNRLCREIELLSITNMTTASLAGFREAITMPAAVEAMGLIKQGGLRAGCRFDPPQNFQENNCSWPVSESDLLYLNRIAAWEAKRLMVDGDLAAAREMIFAQLKLAKARTECPTINNLLIGCYQHGLSLRTVQLFCERQPPSKVEAATLSSATACFDEPDSFAKAYDGDRLFIGEWLYRKYGHELRYARADWDYELYFSDWNPALRFDFAFYLEIIRRQTAAPLERAPLHIEIPAWCCLTKMLIRECETKRKNFIAHLARIRCTEAGLSVLAYKKEHGAWPETLAACMAQVPVDPFNGKPLRYRVTGKGFVVSSVGKIRNTKEISWEYEPETPYQAVGQGGP